MELSVEQQGPGLFVIVYMGKEMIDALRIRRR